MIQNLVVVIIQNKYIYNIMKIIYIYLALVLAITFYLWIHLFKEGFFGTLFQNTNVQYSEDYLAKEEQMNKEREEAEVLRMAQEADAAAATAKEEAIKADTIARDKATAAAQQAAFAQEQAEAAEIVKQQAEARMQAEAESKLQGFPEARIQAQKDAELAAQAQIDAQLAAQAAEDAKSAAKSSEIEQAIALEKAKTEAATAQAALLFAQNQINESKSDSAPQSKMRGFSTYINSGFKGQKVSPGITSIDRYADPMCKPNEYIYCLDGQIECQDILGGKMNNLQGMAPYESGNTLAGCSSYVDKVDVRDYTKDIDISVNTGVYFDLSNCKSDQPWRVGGIVNKVGDISTVSSYKCYPSQFEADKASNELFIDLLNSKTKYNLGDDIYILDSFLQTQILKGLPAMLSVLNKKKTNYTIINGQKYYYGIITSITGKTVTVNVYNNTEQNEQKINLEVWNVPKKFLLKNSLYNKKTNDYYQDLKTGTYPRPICKSGAFTSCVSSSPFIIKNDTYYPTNDPLLIDACYNQFKIERQFDSNTPFSNAPINPSGILDDGQLLEFNYFNSNTYESPFIKCMSDYGSNIGDPLCCNQTGTVTDSKFICPQEVPICSGYSKDDNMYGYCT